MRIASPRHRTIALQFEGVTRHIVVRLGKWDLAVDVIHRGRWFDRILSLDICIAERHRGGWACRLTDDTEAAVYSTKEDLWREHLWEPFLQWVNERLAPARWVRLARSGGVRDAELIKDELQRNVVARLRLLGSMVRFDGQPMIAPREPIEFWIYPVRGDGAVEHFTAQIPEEGTREQ